MQFLYADSREVYPLPPSGSSMPKSTISLLEEAGKFAPLY